MNLSPKKILSVSFGLFVFLFFATLVLSIFLNDPSNPIIDWVLGFAVALVFFWGVYIPFLSIRWVYRRLFPKSPKPVKNPTNSLSPDKDPAAAASLPMLYKILILVLGPALILGLLLYKYWSDPAQFPEPAWAFSLVTMSVTAFTFTMFFLFVQWVYRKTRDTPVGEFYGLPYAERKKIMEDKISKTKLGRYNKKLQQEKAENERIKAKQKAERTRIKKEKKLSNPFPIRRFFASIFYRHKRTKKIINEIMRQINELDGAIMSLEFQIDSYKNSKDKLEKEIYSENKPLFDNLYANINDLEHCVINYCETIEKALEKTEVKQKDPVLKAELQDDINKGLHLKSKRLSTNMPLPVAS